MLASYAAVLRFPPLQLPLMEGLTASIGGLDASLGAAASSALVQALTSARSGEERRGGTEVGPELLMGVTDCLLDIWSRHARYAALIPHPVCSVTSDSSTHQFPYTSDHFSNPTRAYSRYLARGEFLDTQFRCKHWAAHRLGCPSQCLALAAQRELRSPPGCQRIATQSWGSSE